MKEGYGDNTDAEIIETIQAEFICQLYDTKAGPTDIRFYMSYQWDWNSYFYLGRYFRSSYRPPFYFHYGNPNRFFSY